MTGNKERLACLNKIGETLNFSWSCPQLTDGFLSDQHLLVTESIMLHVDVYKPDLIFCHNSEGEYGHPDHKTIFEIVIKLGLSNILISDIIAPVKSSKWEKVHKISDLSYYQNKVCMTTRDEISYEKSRQIYQEHNCWTWKNYPLPSECFLYAINHKLSLERIQECIIEA